MDKNKLPVIEQYTFSKKLWGMELYIPISKDHEDALRKVKIIDAVHFEACDGVHNANEINENNFYELIRIATQTLIFNPDYYISGNLYVRYGASENPYIDELVRYTPNHLEFAKGYVCDIDEIWRDGRRDGYGMCGEVFNLWVELGENRIKEVVSDEPVLIFDEIKCGQSSTDKTIFDQVLFYDKKAKRIYRIFDISDDRKTDITLDDISSRWNSSLHVNYERLTEMTPIKFVKSKGNLVIKEMDISLCMTSPSFNLHIEKGIRSVIVKRKSDSEWYAMINVSAEWYSVVPAKNWAYKDRPEPIIVEPGDVEEVYLITIPSKFLEAIREYHTYGYFKYIEDEEDNDASE